MAEAASTSAAAAAPADAAAAATTTEAPDFVPLDPVAKSQSILFEHGYDARLSTPVNFSQTNDTVSFTMGCIVPGAAPMLRMVDARSMFVVCKPPKQEKTMVLMFVRFS